MFAKLLLVLGLLAVACAQMRPPPVMSTPGKLPTLSKPGLNIPSGRFMPSYGGGMPSGMPTGRSVPQLGAPSAYGGMTGIGMGAPTGKSLPYWGAGAPSVYGGIYGYGDGRAGIPNYYNPYSSYYSQYPYYGGEGRFVY